MPKVTHKVELLACTGQPQLRVAMAARLCYSGAHIENLEEMDEQRQEKLIGNLVNMGHFSPIEHASFTFGIEGVSRALLAQITRHRLASFSVQSQRYVGQRGEDGEFNYIIPPAIAALGQEACDEYAAQMKQMQQWYDGWVKKLGDAGESSNEDARFVLPNACETRMIVTMNARELIHFFSLRCCNRAQWEIRALAWDMLALCVKEAPAIFRYAGPGCVHGACPEGKKTCGKAAQVRERHKKLMEE